MSASPAILALAVAAALAASPAAALPAARQRFTRAPLTRKGVAAGAATARGLLGSFRRQLGVGKVTISEFEDAQFYGPITIGASRAWVAPLDGSGARPPDRRADPLAWAIDVARGRPLT